MNIFKLEFKQRKKSYFIWMAVCVILIIFFMLLYQATMKGLINNTVLIKLADISKIFGFKSISNINQFDTYFIYIYQYIFLIQCLFCLILGVDILRKEEMSNTIQYLYSMPLSRIRIYFGKFIAAVILYTVLIVVAWLAFFGSIAILQYNYIAMLLFAKKVLLLIYYSYLVGITYLALGLFISLLLKNSIKSVIIGLLIFLITYIIGFSNDLKYVSFHSYINPGHYLYSFNILKSIILILAVLFFLIMGCLLYKKKNFNIS